MKIKVEAVARLVLENLQRDLDLGSLLAQPEGEGGKPDPYWKGYEAAAHSLERAISPTLRFLLQDAPQQKSE
jgi:hypothetical protein